jgi:hypothetical protein
MNAVADQSLETAPISLSEKHDRCYRVLMYLQRSDRI